jgi:hypothetical protein
VFPLVCGEVVQACKVFPLACGKVVQACKAFLRGELVVVQARNAFLRGKRGGLAVILCIWAPSCPLHNGRSRG